MNPEPLTHLPHPAERAHYLRLADRRVAEVPLWPDGHFAGRGIVLCAGGVRYFTCAYVAVRILRHLGVTLPIELWYRGPAEMSAAMIELVRPYGVRCVDAYEEARRHPIHRLDGWELKSFAVLHSAFEEVLYLDSDNVPVENPERLFDREEYRATGAVFWPDRYPQSGDTPWLRREAWDVCGVPFTDTPEIEAGQFLVDKRRSWRALHLALHYNEHSEFYYRYFHGDKDTFPMAWRRLGQPFALVPHPLVDTWAALVVYQHDFDGRRIFQHRNGDKWSLAGRNMALPGFEHERECLGFLDELRAVWDGVVRRVPEEFSSAERAVYERLAGRPLVYRIGEAPGRAMRLDYGFTIGEGSGDLERTWMVEEDKDGDVVLGIANDAGFTCFLRRAPDGRWHGMWRTFERQPATVEEL